MQLSNEQTVLEAALESIWMSGLGLELSVYDFKK